MLTKLLKARDQIIVPGVYDALSAKIAVQAGFEALYMSGFAVSGTLLGKPDIGLVTASEMTERARQIVDAAAGVPVFADGDNGYGGEQNVARLVQAYETAGVQCIQLEDQVSPKRCGHMDGKQVVPLPIAVSHIAVAVSSRSSDEFLVMARTDARATHDLAEAIDRGRAFLEAGADILFIEAPRTVGEMEQVRSAFSDVPLVANMVEEGKTPDLSAGELAAMGYQIILRPVSALLAVSKTLQQSYAALLATSHLDSAQARLTFSEFNDLVGLEDG
jgi:2-methylisocitrate lyase-like PEP mutase family enzyme